MRINNIKAVFFDIDGTLVDYNHQVSLSTLNTLDKLRNKGIKIFIASGRPKAQLKDIENIFNVDGYVIMNGSMVYTDHIIYQDNIDSKQFKEVYTYLNKHNIGSLIVDDENTYYNLYHEGLDKEYLNSINYHNFKKYDIERLNNHKVYQMMTYINKKDENIEKEFFNILKLTKGARWNNRYLDVIPIDSGKDRGIKEMLKYFNIELSDTMAIGDSENDIDMLECVGLSVAMGNALDKVKEIADFITKDVDDDGIEYVMKYFNLI